MLVLVAQLVKAMLRTGIVPDFVTVDGGEGGTGAAPPGEEEGGRWEDLRGASPRVSISAIFPRAEFSNSVGMPMAEGLTLVHGLLLGAGLRDEVRITAAGKIVTGFNVVRTLALGADTCSAARAMLFALGCIQSLKCNTNKCPTGWSE